MESSAPNIKTAQYHSLKLLPATVFAVLEELPVLAFR